MKILLFILLLSTTAQAQRGYILCKGEALCKINNDQIRAFVSKHWEASKYIYLTKGVPMAISLSQWILESRYACDPLAKKRKNLGGIMSYEGGKKHLRRFANYEEFYTAYGDVFARECYTSLQPRGLDLWLMALSWPCCSYARSAEYSNKLRRIINLYEFDSLPL